MKTLKYKMVCLDLDGTLLNSKHKISEKTRLILRQLEQKGVLIVIVTGRAAFDAKRHAELISENTYYIGSNGSVIGKAYESILISEKCFTQNLLSETVALSKQMNVKPVLYAVDHIFLTSFRAYLMHLYHGNRMGINPNKYLIFIPSRSKLLKKINEMNVSVHKIIFFAIRPKHIVSLNSKLKNHTKIEMALTGDFCFELTEKGVNKSYGIKILSEVMNINKSEIIAFGDSENDLEMIKYVGLGVAMQNGTDHIKSIADHVTASNNDEGIYIVLKEMLEREAF